MIEIGLILIASYLIGSILVGEIVARLKGIDLRAQGSGNIGATNAFRIMGPVWGSIVLVGDALKGLAAVQLGSLLGISHGFDWAILTGILAIIGHNWSVFAGFHGGKGMATSLGVSVALLPLMVLPALGVWGLTLVLFGYVSLASVAVAVAFPFLVWIFYPQDLYRILIGVVIGCFAIYKHRANLQRLCHGQEHRLLYNKKSTKPGVKE